MMNQSNQTKTLQTDVNTQIFRSKSNQKQSKSFKLGLIQMNYLPDRGKATYEANKSLRLEEKT